MAIAKVEPTSVIIFIKRANGSSINEPFIAVPLSEFMNNQARAATNTAIDNPVTCGVDFGPENAPIINSTIAPIASHSYGISRLIF